jgi:3-methyladenine DNA glycosylase AlkD
MLLSTENIVDKLSSLGSDGVKNIFFKHGAREPLFGVKTEDLKKLISEIPKDQRHSLALKLYETGISDAMYLAGLMADPKQMDRATLEQWVDKAYWYMLSEYTVAWVTAESRDGWNIALEWIRSEKEQTATAGWSALGSYVAITPDSELDKEMLSKLIREVKEVIHSKQNRVRYTMNGFLISVAGYVPDLTEEARNAAVEIGKLDFVMAGTACKLPYAPDYIDKMVQRGKPGQKRKTARC